MIWICILWNTSNISGTLLETFNFFLTRYGGHHSSPVTWHKYCVDYWICHTVKYGEEHACKTREEKVKLSNEVHNFITLIITINRKMVNVDKCYFFTFYNNFCGHRSFYGPLIACFGLLVNHFSPHVCFSRGRVPDSNGRPPAKQSNALTTRSPATGLRTVTYFV